MQIDSKGGFTLVEVLVALFVVAVGIAGASATQAVALRTRQQSALMSDGVQLAVSLAERMRANAALSDGPDAGNPYLQFDYEAAGGAPDTPAPLCFSDAACDPAQMAQFDLYDVAQALYQGFPGGRVRVCRDAAAWDSTQGTLAWPCTPAPGAPIVVKLGWRSKGEAQSAAGLVPGVVIVVAGLEA